MRIGRVRGNRYGDEVRVRGEPGDIVWVHGRVCGREVREEGGRDDGERWEREGIQSVAPSWLPHAQTSHPVRYPPRVEKGRKRCNSPVHVNILHLFGVTALGDNSSRRCNRVNRLGSLLSVLLSFLFNGILFLLDLIFGVQHG